MLVDWLISRLHFALGNAQDGKCDMVSFDATLATLASVRSLKNTGTPDHGIVITAKYERAHVLRLQL